MQPQTAPAPVPASRRQNLRNATDPRIGSVRTLTDSSPCGWTLSRRPTELSLGYSSILNFFGKRQHREEGCPSPSPSAHKAIENKGATFPSLPQTLVPDIQQLIESRQHRASRPSCSDTAVTICFDIGTETKGLAGHLSWGPGQR